MTTCRKLEKGFSAAAMLPRTLYAALFVGTVVSKELCRLPIITAATATTTMAKTAAIAMSATCQNPVYRPQWTNKSPSAIEAIPFTLLGSLKRRYLNINSIQYKLYNK